MDSLKNRASKNFDKYRDSFINGGEEYLIPASRLNKSEWESLNNDLAKESLEMVPYEQKGKSYMRFKRINRKEKITKLLNAGFLLKIDFMVKYFEDITMTKGWEYKPKSGLGFEHIRLNIEKMSKTEIDKVVKICKNRGIKLEPLSMNKGKFLMFNINEYRNVLPNNYTANNKIKNIDFNNSSVQVTKERKEAIQKILDIDLPRNVTNNMATEMQEYTKKILYKYEEAGLIDTKNLDKLAQLIRNNLMMEFSSTEYFADNIINWERLSVRQRRDFINDLNYVTGSQRLNHDNATILIVGDSDINPNGHFYQNDKYKEFMFNKRLLDNSFDSCFGTIVHENIHRFQKQYKSAIPKKVVEYMASIYTYEPYKHYVNNLIECESRYVQAAVMRDFSRDFVKYYNNKLMMQKSKQKC